MHILPERRQKKKRRILRCCFCRGTDVKPRKREKKNQSKLARSPEMVCSLMISWMEERKKKKRHWLVLQIEENTLLLVWADGNSPKIYCHSRLISFFHSLLCSWNNEYAEGEVRDEKGNQCQAATLRRTVPSLSLKIYFDPLIFPHQYSSRS